MKYAVYLFISLLVVSCSKSENETRLHEQLELVKEKNDSLKKILNINRERFRIHMDKHTANSSYLFDSMDSLSIVARGINLTPQQIIDNLHDNKELIPHDAVLGGTMHFENIKLLGDRYAIAFISDGHILGRLIAKYEIKDSSGLKWTVLDSFIYQ